MVKKTKKGLILKKVLRIVILGLVGFALLIYLTLPEERSFQNIKPSFTSIPKYFETIGNQTNKKIEDVFTLGTQKYIIFLNHDSLAVFKDLYKKTEKDIVLIANISNTPWLIKKVAVDGELDNLYKDSKILLINDSNGAFKNRFGLKDDSQNGYFIYKLEENGDIQNIANGFVKKGALQEGITQEEIDETLEKVVLELK